VPDKPDAPRSSKMPREKLLKMMAVMGANHLAEMKRRREDPFIEVRERMIQAQEAFDAQKAYEEEELTPEERRYEIELEHMRFT